MRRPVHVAGFAQLEPRPRIPDADEAEMVQAVVGRALRDAGIDRSEVGFWCSGSNDYVMGRPFSFTLAIDGIGPWPPVRESHVEMDGAWALYEAWVRLQHGDVDVACVYAFGRASVGEVDDVRTLECDPYTVAPLWPGPVHLAALQARVLLGSGVSERDLAAVAGRHLGRDDVDALLAEPYVADPLRAHDCPRATDGAAAVVLRVGGGGPRIAGIAHRIDAHHLGHRDLAGCRSARLAGEAAGALGDVGIDVAELHAPFTSQELILRRALGLGDGVRITPSGGALLADTPMVGGLTRIGLAAEAVRSGARRALGHATSGPCLQHNLVCLLEASP